MELSSRVAARTGLDAAGAERAVHGVLGALAEALAWQEADALAEELPAPLAGVVRAAPRGAPFALAELQARVARRLGLAEGPAHEQVGVVLEALAHALSDGALHRLHNAVDDSIAALLERAAAPPPPPARVAPGKATLAEGRPGSRHPLSEGRADAAHSHSVARSDAPHADTKLSSAQGLTQEREGESLATTHKG